MGLYKPPLYISIYSGLFTFCPFYGGRSQLNGHPHMFIHVSIWFWCFDSLARSYLHRRLSHAEILAQTFEDLYLPVTITGGLLYALLATHFTGSYI